MSEDPGANARTADSLRALLDDTSIPAVVRASLQQEFIELERLLEKLEQGLIHVAVFGRVSVGKSALLNALAGSKQFAVGVLHGTTVDASAQPWRSVEVEGVELIDTPGIDELDGEARERLAFSVAARADVILFVVDGDLTSTEREALAVLTELRRPLLLVLNKSDRYTSAEREQLLGRLRERAAPMLRGDLVLAVSALPTERIVLRVDAEGREHEQRESRPPDVTTLHERMRELLAREGKTLAAVHAGLAAGKLSDAVGERITVARREIAESLLKKYSLAKGVAVGLNPIPVADLLAAATIDVALVLHLGRVYALPLTKHEAGQLVGKIFAQITALMGAIWGVHLVSSALKGLSLGLTTALTAGAQGALAYFSTYVTGKAAEAYFEGGKSWGERGPKRIVQEILQGLDRDSVLREAREEILARLKA